MKKNILFLLSLFIIPIHAITVRENIEYTKANWIDCKNKKTNDCKYLKSAYDTAKEKLYINILTAIHTKTNAIPKSKIDLFLGHIAYSMDFIELSTILDSNYQPLDEFLTTIINEYIEKDTFFKNVANKKEIEKIKKIMNKILTQQLNKESLLNNS